jgi:carlactone synthase/all-trans-10'-apo-beta-carotenal 13,14-cleaving dioxygenase
MVAVKLVVAFLVAQARGADPFACLWKSTWRDIVEPRQLVVSGSIPQWLSGSLLKLAGGAFETEQRNVTAAFDGFPKIFKFNVSSGRVFYQERFLETDYYKYAHEHRDLARVPMMGPTDPKFSPLRLPDPSAGDLTNIQVWRIKGDSHMLALTDSPIMQTFDLETLETFGQVKFKDDVNDGMIQLSASHPQPDPSSEDPESVMINFASVLLGMGTPVRRHEILVFRMGADKIRRPFGSATVPYAPYIHSFSVTKTKMILVVYPTNFEVACVLEFKPMTGCMSCPKDRNATVLVFDLHGDSKHTKPVATIKASNHMAMHHINAYDDEVTGDTMFQVAAHDDCEGLFHGPTGKHAILSVMQTEAERDQVAAWGALRTFRIRWDPSGPRLSAEDTVLRDSENFVYNLDFPFVNPTVSAKKHRFIWAASSYARNSTHYADWALVKVDLSAESYNTRIWQRAGHTPGEPVFVPRPGATAEDDGVILAPVTDGFEERGYLAILNASTLEEIATASLSAGEHLPYLQHGRWFEERTDFLVV